MSHLITFVLGLIIGGALSKPDETALQELFTQARSFVPNAAIKYLIMGAKSPILREAAQKELLYRHEHDINVKVEARDEL